MLFLTMFFLFFFFFQQKTAYEMRISDWSSDVCSSDLDRIRIFPAEPRPDRQPRIRPTPDRALRSPCTTRRQPAADHLPADPTAVHGRGMGQPHAVDRKSVG